MSRHPKFNDSDLYEIATYLAQPETQTDIHVELPASARTRFEDEYRVATFGYSLPESTTEAPYYVWEEDTNKQGIEGRIYFTLVEPAPSIILKVYTDYGKWHKKRNQHRINHTNLFFQLCECGFVLGKNQDNGNRIANFLENKFPNKS